MRAISWRSAASGRSPGQVKQALDGGVALRPPVERQLEAVGAEEGTERASCGVVTPEDFEFMARARAVRDEGRHDNS
jgi:hypothetical protein